MTTTTKNPDLYVGSETSTLAAWRPKAEAWIAKHGEPHTMDDRVEMYERTGVDWSVFVEMSRGAN